MGRPRIYDKPMTPAERQRQSRAARKEGKQLKPELTEEQIPRPIGWSVRTHYYIKIIQQHGIPELLEAEILDNIGARTLADLARHYHRKAQREFVAMVRKKGVL